MIRKYYKETPYSCAFVRSHEYGVFKCGAQGMKVDCPCVSLSTAHEKLTDMSHLCPGCVDRSVRTDIVLIDKICNNLTDHEILQLEEMLNSSSDYMWQEVKKIAAKKFPKLYKTPNGGHNE
jgi:hypothetical protein